MQAMASPGKDAAREFFESLGNLVFWAVVAGVLLFLGWVFL